MSNIATLKSILITLLLAAGLSCIPITQTHIDETIVTDFKYVAQNLKEVDYLPSGHNELKKLKDDMFNTVIEVRLDDGLTIPTMHDSNHTPTSKLVEKKAQMVVNYVTGRNLKYSRLTGVIDSVPFKELVSYTGNVYRGQSTTGPFLFEQKFIKNLDQSILPGSEYPIKSMIALYASILADISMLNNHTKRSHCMVRPQAFGLKDGYMNLLNVSGASFLGGCGVMHMATIPPEYYTEGLASIGQLNGHLKIFEHFALPGGKKSYMDGYAATITFFFLLRNQIKGENLKQLIEKASSNIKIDEKHGIKQDELNKAKKNMVNFFPGSDNKIAENIENLYVNVLNVTVQVRTF